VVQGAVQAVQAVLLILDMQAEVVEAEHMVEVVDMVHLIMEQMVDLDVVGVGLVIILVVLLEKVAMV
jgi:hypothetical protein